MSLWRKPSVWMALFFLSFNVSAGVLGAMGVWGYLGIQPDTGPDTAYDDEVTNVESVDTGSGTGSTLFGLYNTLGGPLSTIVNMVFPGAAFLKRIGVPALMVDLLFTTVPVVTSVDIISWFRSG